VTAPRVSVTAARVSVTAARRDGPHEVAGFHGKTPVISGRSASTDLADGSAMKRQVLLAVALLSVAALTSACQAPSANAREDVGAATEALYTPPAKVDAYCAGDGMEDGQNADGTPCDAGFDVPPLTSLNGFQFVLHQGQPYVVLDSLPDEGVTGGVAVSAPSAPSDSLEVAAVAPIEQGAAGIAERFPAGQELALYDDDGVACMGTTGKAAILYRDMLIVDAPADEDDPSAAFAARVRTEKSQSMLLVAPLEVHGGDCTGTWWARPASMKAPRIFTQQGEATEVKNVRGVPSVSSLVALARSLPAHRRAQQDYDEMWDAARSEPFAEAWTHAERSAPKPEHWDEDAEASRFVRRYVDEDGGRAIDGIELAVLNPCGGFYDSVWAYADANGTLAASLSGIDDGAMKVLDIDDDGTLELASGHALYVETPHGRAAFFLPEAYSVCRC
jgi:hypothetical protein